MENGKTSATQLLAELLKQRADNGGSSALDDEVRRAMSWKSAEERERLAEYLLKKLEDGE